MKRYFALIFSLFICCVAIFSTVQTEMRMCVYRNGDDGTTMSSVLSEVDSVRFVLDTLKFKVAFNDWDGIELQSSIVQSGSMPKYVGDSLKRESTAKYTYVFDQWSPEIGEVQEDITYTAVYDSILRNYWVVFLGANNEVLSIKSFDYGTHPSYDGVSPTKESSKVYDYIFTGWNPTISSSVVGNVTYKAEFDSIKHDYVCIFNNVDGNLFLEVEDCHYDSFPTKIPYYMNGSDYSFSFKGWNRDELKIGVDTLIYNAVYDSTLYRKDGTLVIASFKVSDTTRIYFSQGNLQFNAKQGVHKTVDSTAQGTWRFAENQFDFVGGDNKNASSTYDGWIDLFSWGTSGWNSGAEIYWPWGHSPFNSRFYPGGDKSNNLTGNYANADWGVYNGISNGGNETNQWRTLTGVEWGYLLKNNEWTLGYIKTSELDSVLCCFFIPENFVAPLGFNISIINNDAFDRNKSFSISESDYSGNIFDREQFAVLERMGVVALPASGRGSASVYSTGGVYVTIYYSGLRGFYWSSTQAGEYISALGFYTDSAYVWYYEGSSCCPVGRGYCQSVRLVKNIR